MKKFLFTIVLNAVFFCSGAKFDVEHLREYADLDVLKESCVEHSKKLKGVKGSSFLARVFRDLYGDTIACKKFGKEKIYETLLIYITEAIKRGDVRTLIFFAHDNPAIEVPVRAMILLITGTNNSCYALHTALKEAYPKQYDKKIEELFGKQVTLAQGTIENDRGRFCASPAVLDFTPETIERLKNFLENFSTEKELKDVLSSALDTWGKVCSETDCSKLYQEIYCMKFKGFDI